MTTTQRLSKPTKAFLAGFFVTSTIGALVIACLAAAFALIESFGHYLGLTILFGALALVIGVGCWLISDEDSE